MTDETTVHPWAVFSRKPGEIMIQQVQYFATSDEAIKYRESKKDDDLEYVLVKPYVATEDDHFIQNSPEESDEE